MVLKVSRNKIKLTFKGRPVIITPAYYIETIKDKRARKIISQALEEKQCITIASSNYYTQLNFQFEGEIKSFYVKNR